MRSTKPIKRETAVEDDNDSSGSCAVGLQNWSLSHLLRPELPGEIAKPSIVSEVAVPPSGLRMNDIPLLWWEADELSWVEVQRAATPFFDDPGNHYDIEAENFGPSLEQVWALMMGLS